MASVIVDMKHPGTTSNHCLWGSPATVPGLRQKTSSRQNGAREPKGAASQVTPSRVSSAASTTLHQPRPTWVHAVGLNVGKISRRPARERFFSLTFPFIEPHEMKISPQIDA